MLICHQLEILVVLYVKYKQQGEDKSLGEKYHLAEIWFHGLHKKGWKLHLSQGTVIVVHLHNTIILLCFFLPSWYWQGE